MTSEKWLEETDGELERMIEPWFKGIRPIPLKKLFYFMLVVIKRFESTDWNEWKNRIPYTRESLNHSIKTYLQEKDKTEIEFYMKRLRWSRRTVYDYWNTLYNLTAIVTIEQRNFGLKE
jgi:hypothetical protein